MWSHWQDAMTVLKKPLVFSEFGKSKEDPGHSTTDRDAYIDVVYGDIYSFARSGGAFGGGLVWQIMAEGMESYYDGYEIVLSQDASTYGVIARQSHLMTALSHVVHHEPAPWRRRRELGAGAEPACSAQPARPQPAPSRARPRQTARRERAPPKFGIGRF